MKYSIKQENNETNIIERFFWRKDSHYEENGRFYIKSSDNPKEDLERHNAGKWCFGFNTNPGTCATKGLKKYTVSYDSFLFSNITEED